MIARIRAIISPTFKHVYKTRSSARTDQDLLDGS